MDYHSFLEALEKDLIVSNQKYETVKFFRSEIVSVWIWFIIMKNYYTKSNNNLNIEKILEQRTTLGHEFAVMSYNILRFPSFQSPLVLPDDLRNKFKLDLVKFLNTNEKHLEQMEINQTQRLIDYLDVVKTPHEGAATQDKLQKDFKAFYSQYDKRTGKDFEKTFPIIGEWYRGI